MAATVPPPPPAPSPDPDSSARVPKKKAIRLPFHVSYLPKEAVAKTQRLCGICRLKTSPYACPRCQVPYCSLACYQDTARHAQCSEPFYKQEIELELAATKQGGAAGATKEEQNRMVEMLRRFEEGANDDGPLEWDGDEADADREAGDGLDDLAELLETAGLDGVPPEELLAMLPAELRSQFLTSVATSSNQPSSVIQTLLESDELKQDEDSPWWLDADAIQGPPDLAGPPGATQVPRAAMRPPPELIPVPAGLQPSAEVAQRVMYNVAALAIAYVHTTLTFRRSPLSVTPPAEPQGAALEEARAMLDHLLSLVPFVEEPKSTVSLASFKEARLYTNSHLDQSSALPPKVLSAHVIPLLRPPSPIGLADAAPSPHPFSLALSDVHRLLGLTAMAATRSAHRRIQKKLDFFGACVSACTRDDWQLLSAQVDKVVQRELFEQQGDGGDDSDETPAADLPSTRSELARADQQPQRKIEVLSDDDETLPPASITELVENDGAAARLDP